MFLPVASLGIDDFCRVKNNLRPQRTVLSCEDCEAIGSHWEVHSFDWFLSLFPGAVVPLAAVFPQARAMP